MRRQSAILTYHSLDESGSPISTSPALFRSQMETLAGQGVAVVSIEEVVTRPGAVALAFDDGFSSFLTHAWPVLEKLGFPATVFVVPDYCGAANNWPCQPARIPRMPLMGWRDLEQLARHGVQLGAHGANHADLRSLSGYECIRQMEESRRRIEQECGVPADVFAYPYGGVNESVKAAARERFRLACGTRLDYLPGTDLWDLPRLDAWYLRNPAVFRRLWDGAGRGYISFRRGLRSLRTLLT